MEKRGTGGLARGGKGDAVDVCQGTGHPFFC